MPLEAESSFQIGKAAGDYVISRLISKGTNTSTWAATQVSVQREVLVCSLDDAYLDDHQTRAEFIADVRIKAAVDHPLIASILEAVNEGPLCFFAYEKINGKDLGDLHEQGKLISPLHVARIIKNVSSACEHLEATQVATLPLSPHDIFVDRNYHCRISNLAVSGAPQQAATRRDKELLGHLLQDMLQHNEPGSTRTSSLLGCMAYLNNAEPKTWHQIYDLSGEIEHQLTGPVEGGQIKSSTMRIDSPWARFLRATTLTGRALLIITGLVIIIGIGSYLINLEPKPEPRILTDMVNIQAGKYPGPYGLQVKVHGFWMDAHEVTIQEYAEFLRALDALPEDIKTVYQHEDQPDNKKSHHPDDWENLYEAAKQGGQWNNQSIDLYYPVVGVDWWDAHAYAEWKGRSLPNYEDWYAACSAGSNPENLKGSGLNAVDQTPQTAIGLYGMAGNVSEWIQEPTLDPADPSAPPRYMVSGASYLRPKYGARAREWVDSRNLRRPDIGFRTCNKSRQRK